MKGIVFTEFLEMVEGELGPLQAQRVLDSCALQSGGAYTSVGTYPCEEMGMLVGAVSKTTGQCPTALFRVFGHHLAASFKEAYPQYFETDDFFDFVESIDSRIHVEVQKLYADAELPQFHIIMRTDDTLVVDYHSSRALEHLAHGLLEASALAFGETVEIAQEPVGDSVRRVVRFRLTRRLQ